MTSTNRRGLPYAASRSEFFVMLCEALRSKTAVERTHLGIRSCSATTPPFLVDAIEFLRALLHVDELAGVLATQTLKSLLRHFTLRVSFSPENPNTTYILAGVSSLRWWSE